jgi:hypothetical protein
VTPEYEALISAITARASEIDAIRSGEGAAAVIKALESALQRMEMELSRVKLERQIEELNEQTRRLRDRKDNDEDDG